jgi:hypothetical protein
MLTPQQSADIDLSAWQDGRRRGLSPEQRMEELFFDFLVPPLPCEVEYEATLRVVREEMAA